VQGVLDQVEPQALADDGRPLFRLRPSLHRETRVDPQLVGGHPHASGIRMPSPPRTSSNHRARMAPTSMPHWSGSNRRARPTAKEMALRASSPIPAAAPASMAVPMA